MPSLPAIRAGGVQKPGGTLNKSRNAGGLSTSRRPGGGAGMLYQQRRRRRRRRTSLDISLSEEEEEYIDTEATEDVDMDAAGNGADSDGEYLNTHRSRTSHHYEGARTGMLSTPMPHSAPPISGSRRHRSGQCPGAKVSPNSAGGLRGGGGSVLSGVSLFSRSAPASPHTPHARASSMAPAAYGNGVGQGKNQITADEVADYDSLDLNFVLSSLVDEPSLTYSANDESYLFESMPVDANHTALVHLGGVELFQNSGSESPPDSPLMRDSSSGDVATPSNNVSGNIVTTGSGDYFPGTPLPTALSLGLNEAGVGGASPKTPASGGGVPQHSQLQIPPNMYHTSLPFTSAFAAAF